MLDSTMKRTLTGFIPYLQGELMDNWIRPLAHYQDGHCDMQALWNHYAGEGNSTHCIADAKHIQAALHYE